MERTVTIEEQGIYREDYQMRILQANDIQGFLKVRGRGADKNSCYDYNVSGKISLQALYDRNNIGEKEIKKFIKTLMNIMSETERHLLNINRILLKPEYIYYEDGEYYFCYYPPGKGNIWEEFHVFTEYLVKHADYNDSECVRIVFLLHKETMEENYSLKKIAEECMASSQSESVDQKKQDTEKVQSTVEYDSAHHDWIASQEMGSLIMEETEYMWSPVKRFLKKHKKPKWGDWDGLYIEEEEL